MSRLCRKLLWPYQKSIKRAVRAALGYSGQVDGVEVPLIKYKDAVGIGKFIWKVHN